MEELYKLSKPAMLYPYEMIMRMGVDRSNPYYPQPFVENV